MSSVNSLSLNSGKQDALPIANISSLEDFIKYMDILASSSEFQFAATVLDKIIQQYE